jgi:hypothetical protein
MQARKGLRMRVALAGAAAWCCWQSTALAQVELRAAAPVAAVAQATQAVEIARVPARANGAVQAAGEAGIAAGAPHAPPQADARAHAMGDVQAASGTAQSRADERFGLAISAAQLDAHRGGDALIGQNDLTGRLSNTAANRVVTGSNSISQGSFSNASGLPTVIQNSGANVLIQNATVLNVRFGE